MSERLVDLWPSLYSCVQRQIVNPDRDDPGWMDDLAPWEHEELRREAKKELEMMEREAKRRSDGGHLKQDDVDPAAEIAERRERRVEGRE